MLAFVAILLAVQQDCKGQGRISISEVAAQHAAT